MGLLRPIISFERSPREACERTLTLTLTLIRTLTLTRCKYCRLQRALFGTEGAAALPYVECAANGFGAQKCPPEVDGFPTWKVHDMCTHHAQCYPDWPSPNPPP